MDTDGGKKVLNYLRAESFSCGKLDFKIKQSWTIFIVISGWFELSWISGSDDRDGIMSTKIIPKYTSAHLYYVGKQFQCNNHAMVMTIMLMVMSCIQWHALLIRIRKEERNKAPENIQKHSPLIKFIPHSTMQKSKHKKNRKNLFVVPLYKLLQCGTNQYPPKITASWNQWKRK